jgi:hypothetical protein
VLLPRVKTSLFGSLFSVRSVTTKNTNVRNDLKIIESKRPTTMTINSGNDCSINDVQTWFTAQLGRPQQMHAPLPSSNACEPTSTVTKDV